MATYCFGGGCESNGWMLVFYSTKYMTSATIYNYKSKSEYIDCDFWLKNHFNPSNIDFKTLV